MEFNLTKFLPSNWLHALGTTLFHSLWLGVLLSLIVAIILFSTRKTSAALRYNLLTASLFLFFFAIGLIFYNALGINFSEQRIRLITENVDWKPQFDAGTSIQTDLQSVVKNVISIWDAYSSQIVLIWFLIICIKSIQLVTGLTGIHHIKNNKIYAAGKKWDEKLAELSKRIGLTEKVGILQSGIAQVPMVVGHFRPLILIPLGLLNGLSDEEVEAILCHELAHIKRRDYLVNLLQTFIEIVFFFNPAVLWVSKLIREERENCCDDLAVSQMEDKRSYVKALITCQEFQLNAPRFAMAVSGKKNHLFQRISRMLFDTKTTLNKMEKAILTIALISVVICSAAFKNVADSDTLVKSKSKAYEHDFQDTTKKKISKAEIDKKRTDLKRAEASRMAIEDAKRAQEDSKQAVEDSKHAIEDAKIAIEDAKQAKEDVRQAVMDAKQAKEDAKQNKNDNLNVNVAVPPFPAVPASQKMLIPIGLDVPIVPELLNPAAPPAPSVAPFKFYPKSSGKDKSKKITVTGTQRTVQSITSTNADVHDYKSIIKEMLKDGLAGNPDKLSYKLDKNSLIVNGVKQPENYHLKYKNKYIQSDNTALLYKYQMESN